MKRRKANERNMTSDDETNDELCNPLKPKETEKKREKSSVIESVTEIETEAEPMNLEKEVHPKPKKIGSNKESSKKKSDNVKDSEEKTAKIKQKKLPKESLEIIKKKNTIKDFFNSL